MVINMVAEIKKNCSDLGFVILMPGQPVLKERLENMAELVGLSDVMISTGKREGLYNGNNGDWEANCVHKGSRK